MVATTTISAALALALGLRHGLDADHLAAIDGLTRWNAAAERSSMARYCGALFSVGHGGIIVLVALALALLAREWTPPEWLALTGAFVSATTLILLSLLNLKSLLNSTHAHAPVAGLRSRAFASLLRTRRPWQVAAVGALFALSFDALGLAALFAAAAAPSGGIAGTALLALLFAGGMIAVDSLNGFWVARLVTRSDHASIRASRVMTLTISIVGLAVGVFVALSTTSEALDEWLSAHETAVSGTVICAILLGYLAGLASSKYEMPARQGQ